MSVENRLMALERAKAEEIEALQSKLEDVADEIAMSRQSAEEQRLAIRGEMGRVIKDAQEERNSLSAKIQRMQAELERKETEIENSEKRRVEIEEALEKAQEDNEMQRTTSNALLEEAQAQRSVLEQQISQIQADLESEAERARQRDHLETELVSMQSELASVKATTSRTIEILTAQKLEIEQSRDAQVDVSDLIGREIDDVHRNLENDLATAREQLAEAKAEAAGQRDTLVQERLQKEQDVARLLKESTSTLVDVKAELEATQAELSSALERAAELETRDSPLASSSREDAEAAARRVAEVSDALEETKASVLTLEKHKNDLEAQLRDFEDREQEWIAQEKAMLEDLAQVERQLDQAQ
jgi:early endosome antigen 1